MKKEARRDSILNGVIALLATHGLEGVTHRAVDEVAGLPQGSSSYYFPRKVQLLMAAAGHLARILEVDCDELQRGFAEEVAKHGLESALKYVAEEVMSYTDTSRNLFLARMELTLAAARRDDLPGVGEQLTAAARRPIVFFLRLVANGEIGIPAETAAGLIDGISLMYATGQGPKPTADQMAAVFRAIVRPAPAP